MTEFYGLVVNAFGCIFLGVGLIVLTNELEDIKQNKIKQKELQ